MSYLLDASALIPSLLDYGEELLNILAKVKIYAIDLTVYEAGNSLWKLVTILNTITLEDAEDMMDVIISLIRRDIIRIIYFKDLNLHRIVELAVSEKITFYDTTYITASEKIGAILVTEDKKLKEKAEKYIKVLTYPRFKHKIKEELKGR